MKDAWRLLISGQMAAGGWCAIGVIAAMAVGQPTSRPADVLPQDSMVTITLGRPQQEAGESQAVGRLMASMKRGMVYKRWGLHVESVPESRDGVFWKVVAEPLEIDYETDHPGSEMNYEEYARQIPLLRVPAHLWESWVDSDMRQVVGIHYHDLGSLDATQIFYTRYAHPARSVPVGPQAGKQGTRIEGTLLLPVTWWLDQAIVLRDDGKEPVTGSRIEHERGHAADALQDLVQTIAGPTSWDEATCTGQKCGLVWRWRTERLARTWDGIFGGKKKILTLRTYVDVLPPTRWSVLMDRPVSEVTDRDVRALNDSLVLIDERYEKNRVASTKAFHKEHGGYEGDGIPRFHHPGLGVKTPAGR